MNAERKKILEMLAQGKISAEEAEQLLEKLAGPASTEAKAEDGSSAKPRFMRIVIEKPGQDQVNIRMPLSFMRSGRGLLAVLPTKVSEKLAEIGLDFSAGNAMSEKEWAAAVENMNIDVEKGSGKKVRIFCE
jgi:hypothetical protein